MADISNVPGTIATLDGKVGIGTTAPSSLLHLEGTVAGPSSNVAALIKNLDLTGYTQLSLTSAVASGGSPLQLLSFGSSYSGTAGSNVGIVSSGLIRNNNAGGLVISAQATGADAIIRFCTNGTPLSSSLRFAIDNSGNVVTGNAALATSATDGFFYVPSCAGAPSATPTAYTGRVPLIYDTTNNRLYAYNAAWKLMAAV